MQIDARKFLVVALLGLGALSFGMLMEDGVAASAAEAKPLKAGVRVPDATLMGLDGKEVKLKNVLGKKPTVLIFYRGSWCPFCNAHLAELGKIEGDVRARGYQIVAISPDLPVELKKTLDKNNLTYKLYSDSTAEAMKKFGVAYRLDDQTFTTYRDKYNVDLERSSGQKHHILPVPSVYVVNPKGSIVFAYSNPDYKVRLSGKDLLAALDANK